MKIPNLFKAKADPIMQQAEDPSTATPQKVSLTKNKVLNQKIDLRKKTIFTELEKSNIQLKEARVVFVLDHSRSMAHLYNDGTVQDTLERIFPLALTFDDNGEMEFYLFDTLFKELDPVNIFNIDGYTQDVIMVKRGKYGATCYAPIIEEITEQYAKKNPSKIPTLVIFITDGNNSDKKNAKEALSIASHYNIFWKFVGIGSEKFDFLEKLDTMSGRFIDNANFVSINHLTDIDDDKLYQLLLEELGDWLKLCIERNMI